MQCYYYSFFSGASSSFPLQSFVPNAVAKGFPLQSGLGLALLIESKRAKITLFSKTPRYSFFYF